MGALKEAEKKLTMKTKKTTATLLATAASTPTLEQRVAALEQEIAALRQTLANGGQGKNWHKLVGFFGDDPGMVEIFETAMKLREEDRAKARRRQPSSRRGQ